MTATFFVAAKWPQLTDCFDNLRLTNGHILAQDNQREREYVEMLFFLSFTLAVDKRVDERRGRW